MDAKHLDHPPLMLAKTVRAMLLTAPFLISACSDSGGSDGLGAMGKTAIRGISGEDVAGIGGGITPRTQVDPEIGRNIQAATVKINVVGDAVLPRNLTSVEIQKRGSGSGFFISDTGYIVTNNHVVTGAGQVTVLVDGVSRPYSARIVGVAECEDLALLETTTGNSGFATLSWSDMEPQIGMEIAASGFPGDVSDSVNGGSVYTLSTGIINTYVRQHNTVWASTDIFDHSARTAPGSSGGPVVDMDTGDVLGVNYAGDGSRFKAISVSEAKRIIDKIAEGRDVLSIGISGKVVFKYTEQDGDTGLAFSEDIPENARKEPFGIWVTGLQANGKAKNTGLQPGDIIIAMGGVKLQFDQSDNDPARMAKMTMGEYCNVLRSNDPNEGTAVDIKIYRPKAGGVTCAGEINGAPLSLDGNPDLPCPSRPPATGGNSDDSDDSASARRDHSDSERDKIAMLPGYLSHSDYRADSGAFEGKHMDMYLFSTTSSGEVTVEMRSTAIDSYLIVALLAQDGENIDDFYHDDDSGSGLNARVTFHKQEGREYVILATSAYPEESGSYELHFNGLNSWEVPMAYEMDAASAGAPTPPILQNLEMVLTR